MAAEKGRAFLLKIGDGQPSESFATIAGMRSTRLSINSELVDITNKDSGGWRELLSDGGIRRVSISGAGVFTNSQVEVDLQAKALVGAIANYRIVFESGDMFAGAFLVSALDYAGEHNGERSYTLSLESSGAVTFTAV